MQVAYFRLYCAAAKRQTYAIQYRAVVVRLDDDTRTTHAARRTHLIDGRRRRFDSLGRRTHTRPMYLRTAALTQAAIGATIARVLLRYRHL